MWSEVFRSTIIQPFQFESEQRKICGNESHEKETKQIYASAVDLLHIRIENLDWRARVASLIQLFWASSRLLVTLVSLIYMSSSFFFPGVAERNEEAGWI